MSTERTEILKELKGIFGNIDASMLVTSPNFSAIIALRNGLIERDFTREEANMIIAKVKITIPMDIFDDAEDKELIFEIVDLLADMITEMWALFKPELDSFDLFVQMVDGANLEITD